MTLTYDDRAVPPHGDSSEPSVFLMNEAPGPSEAASGIPLYGQQGANIFHALRASGILWAVDHPRFVWPKKDAEQVSKRHREKAAFLATRAKHITCTNAYPYWPKPTANSIGFCAPADDDVLLLSNLERIRKEVTSSHRIILICGRSAYLACLGENLPYPASRERTKLSVAELKALNQRMLSHFEEGWYMGHTRRWLTRSSETTHVLIQIAKSAGWSLNTNVG